ncbi:MAG: MOSC domain-containing protein [Marinosulfonomonas sp.]|nr:MOSC domain-containing protein [Marinosulfonomonas sp.]
MPALVPTEYTGKIVWLGRVPDRDASLKSTAMEEVFASFAGVSGEAHAGLTRPSDSRVLSQYPRDTEIRNVRQFSIVSAEDLRAVADAMGLAVVDPTWLGASMVIEGIPDFTYIPPTSRLQSEAGTTLTVDMENLPCHLVSKVIVDETGAGNMPFKQAAKGRRGVTAWVEREGMLRLGDQITLHVPGQRAWQPE